VGSVDDNPSCGRNESGFPGCMFGDVVTADYEALPKGVVVGVRLLLCDY
jgi:hypothetical protein